MKNRLKKLGIAGGMGPAATAEFYKMLIAFTDAQNDSDHIDILLYSKASTLTPFGSSKSCIKPRLMSWSLVR